MELKLHLFKRCAQSDGYHFSAFWLKSEILSGPVLVTTHGKATKSFLTHKQESVTLQTLRKIEGNLNQPWAALYIYLFGLNLRFDCPNFASNNYVHNIENVYEKRIHQKNHLKNIEK